MTSRVTSLNLSDYLRKRVDIASASMGLSMGEYIRRAVVCVLLADADSDPALRAHFAFLAERENVAKATSEAKPRERVGVSA